MTELLAAGSTPMTVLACAPVARIDPRASIAEAAATMAAAGVGALVLGAGDEPPGIVTERDLVGVVAAGVDSAATPIGDVASTALVWCDIDATVAEVAELMMERYVRHVLVEDRGRMVGIVSARDLLGVYAAEDMETEPE